MIQLKLQFHFNLFVIFNTFKCVFCWLESVVREFIYIFFDHRHNIFIKQCVKSRALIFWQTPDHRFGPEIVWF